MWPAPLALVAGLLPRGVSLAPQPVTGPNEHPLVFLLGRQWGVNVHLGPFRARGCEYLEFLVAVPFVTHEAPAGAYRGPFVFMPRLYLDNWPFVIAGWFYAYDKRRARSRLEADGYGVRSLFAGAPLVSATFQERGSWGPLSAYPNVDRVIPVFQLPFIGRLGFGPFVRSNLVFHMERARIAPLAAQIRIDQPFVAGLPAGTHSFPGIDESPFGAFRIEVPWTLGPPSWLAPFAPASA